MKFKRVYHPYTEWEEIQHNMWGVIKNRSVALEEAKAFTGDHKKYGAYMMRVIKEWPISCENALTDLALNRRAWIGHAACALAMQCPEDIVRQAWKELTYEQRLLANAEASRAIQRWEYDYAKSKGLLQVLGETLL